MIGPTECQQGGDAERHDDDDAPFPDSACRQTFDLPGQDVQIRLRDGNDETERQTGTGQEKEIGGLGECPTHRLADHADAEIDAVQENGEPGGDAEGAKQKTFKLQCGQRRQCGMQQQDDRDDGKDRLQHFADF